MFEEFRPCLMSLAVEMNGQLTVKVKLRTVVTTQPSRGPKTGLGKYSFSPGRQKVAGQTPHGDWKLQKSNF